MIMFIIYYNFNHQHRHCHPYYHYEPLFCYKVIILVLCTQLNFCYRRTTQLMREDDDSAVPYCVSLGDAAKVLYDSLPVPV